MAGEALSPRGEPLARSQGLTIFLLCCGGFALGEVLGLLAAVIAAAAANFHGSLTHLATMANQPWWYVASGLVGIWAGFLAGVLAGHASSGTLPRAAWSLRWSDARFVVLGVALQYAVIGAYVPFEHTGQSGNSQRIFGTTAGWAFWLLAVMTVFLAPLVEECFFRGTLLPGLGALFGASRARAGAVVAVVVDGALFGLAHAELFALAGLVAVGVVLAAVYYRFGRIWPCVLTHVAFNATAVGFIIYDRGLW